VVGTDRQATVNIPDGSWATPTIYTGPRSGLDIIYTRSATNPGSPGSTTINQDGTYSTPSDWFDTPTEPLLGVDNPPAWLASDPMWQSVGLNIGTDMVWGDPARVTGPKGETGDNADTPQLVFARTQGNPANLDPTNSAISSQLGRTYWIIGDVVEDNNTAGDTFGSTGIDVNGTRFTYQGLDSGGNEVWTLADVLIDNSGNVTASAIAVQRMFAVNATIASTLIMGDGTTNGNGVIQSHNFGANSGFQLNGK